MYVQRRHPLAVVPPHVTRTFTNLGPKRGHPENPIFELIHSIRHHAPSSTVDTQAIYIPPSNFQSYHHGKRKRRTRRLVKSPLPAPHPRFLSSPLLVLIPPISLTTGTSPASAPLPTASSKPKTTPAYKSLLAK